jgi:hypothetical protein
MKLFQVAATVTALTFIMTTPGVADGPFSYTLTVSASAANMPMTGNSKMTSSMSGSAKAKLTLNTSKNTLCYSITSMGLVNMTEAHVQMTSTEKDVVVMNPKKINSQSPTCMKVNHQVLTGLISHPLRYSFMIHTKADPNGAVMGNLMKG